MELIDNPKGNYRFSSGIAPYSSGVLAAPGYEIVHAVLHKPPPYRQGFELVDRHLSAQGRPRHALCAIELRIPRPFSFEGFAEFNAGYRELLADWDLLVDERNPVARTNIAPEVGAPGEPSLYAFSYTASSSGSDGPPTFVVAGAGDLYEQELSPEAIVRPGETSIDALREKAEYVRETVEMRMDSLGVGWPDVTVVNVYTVHPLQPFLAAVILESMGQAAVHGVHWYYSHPPIAGLAFEMDVRGVRRETRTG